jgi:hypothetical protein
MAPPVANSFATRGTGKRAGTGKIPPAHLHGASDVDCRKELRCRCPKSFWAAVFREVVPFLKDPTSLIAATAAQDPYSMAEKAVTIGYDIINGKKPTEAVTLIPVQLITKNNVSSYTGWTK